jgi:hypothetical protein
VRVTYLLDYLGTKNRESIAQIKQKYQVHKTVLTVLRKYCAGELGFDQGAARDGSFQLALIKLMVLLASDFAVYLFFLQNKAEQQLAQMLEEASIFLYEDSIQGSAYRHHDLILFLFSVLDYIELSISKHFQEYFPSVRLCLTRVHERVNSLFVKKDNALLRHFMTEESDHESQEIITYRQLEELRMTSPSLADFSQKVLQKLHKMDALTDFAELHEDKYARLFTANIKDYDADLQHTP